MVTIRYIEDFGNVFVASWQRKNIFETFSFFMVILTERERERERLTLLLKN